MIDCPYCHHKEVIGAMFCSECGSQLTPDDPRYMNLHRENSTSQATATPEQTASPASNRDSIVSLFIMDAGQTIPLVGKDEFTIGRNSEGQSLISDVDLTPYHGYELGVSRMHTTIKIEGDEAYAIDLGSANGTRINGQEILSNKPNQLKHGDIITLGKFKIQILIHQ